nr:hypothetical protein Itr_chr03CG02260 [Ipomoea trifida]
MENIKKITIRFRGFSPSPGFKNRKSRTDHRNRLSGGCGSDAESCESVAPAGELATPLPLMMRSACYVVRSGSSTCELSGSDENEFVARLKVKARSYHRVPKL